MCSLGLAHPTAFSGDRVGYRLRLEERACIGSAQCRVNAPLGMGVTFQFLIKGKKGSKKKIQS